MGWKCVRDWAVPAHTVPLPACVLVFRPSSLFPAFLRYLFFNSFVLATHTICLSAMFCTNTTALYSVELFCTNYSIWVTLWLTDRSVGSVTHTDTPALFMTAKPTEPHRNENMALYYIIVKLSIYLLKKQISTQWSKWVVWLWQQLQPWKLLKLSQVEWRFCLFQGQSHILG